MRAFKLALGLLWILASLLMLLGYMAFIGMFIGSLIGGIVAGIKLVLSMAGVA